MAKSLGFVSALLALTLLAAPQAWGQQYTKRGELFYPEEGASFTADPVTGYATVHVWGLWKSKNRVTIKIDQDVIGHATPAHGTWAWNCGPQYPCPVKAYRHEFDADVQVPIGCWGLKVHKDGNTTAFAKPVDYDCWWNEMLSTGDFCAAVDQCKEGDGSNRRKHICVY